VDRLFLVGGRVAVGEEPTVRADARGEIEFFFGVVGRISDGIVGDIANGHGAALPEGPPRR
jgi:hypothetical protein